MIDVVDTNVIAVANGYYENIENDCLSNCIDYLSQHESKKFALDDTYEILNEYFRYANRSGQPNIGDAFVKWLWENHTNPNVCELVTITKSEDEDILYNEIPDIENLTGFDRSDQKFLAVALQTSQDATIINATDSDWINYHKAITSLGISINNICPGRYELT